MRKYTTPKYYHFNRAVRFIAKGQIERLVKEIKVYPHLVKHPKISILISNMPEVLKALADLESAKHKPEIQLPETGSLWAVMNNEEAVVNKTIDQGAKANETIFKSEAESEPESASSKLFTELEKIADGEG